jgi:hypothetical protein
MGDAGFGERTPVPASGDLLSGDGGGGFVLVAFSIREPGDPGPDPSPEIRGAVPAAADKIPNHLGASGP